MKTILKNLDLSKDELPANVDTDAKNVKVVVDKIDIKVNKLFSFLVLACHQPELDGFHQHFQATVHFP